MFGNRQGWMISAVIVVLFGVFLYEIQILQQPSPPSAEFAADPDRLAEIALPIGPETVLPTLTEPGDAADSYRDAIKAYEDDPKPYDKFDKTKTAVSPGVKAVVAATNIKEMHLFSKGEEHIKKLVNYVGDKDKLDAIKKVGHAVGLCGSMAKHDKKYDEAKQFGAAEFSLGVKLFQERLKIEELEAGLDLMGSGLAIMQSVADELVDNVLFDACKKFDDARRAYSAKTIAPRRNWLPALDGAVIGAHAGDTFALATDSKERMWRIEAMLQMGRMRYTVGENGRGADQVYANRLLKKFAENEKEQAVKIAAIAGRDLDEGTYNNQTASGHPQ